MPGADHTTRHFYWNDGKVAAREGGNDMKRAVLLSGSLGAGHEMHARACAMSLAGRGWATGTLDAMRLLGPRGGSAGGGGFRALAAAPGVFDAVPFARLR